MKCYVCIDTTFLKLTERKRKELNLKWEDDHTRQTDYCTSGHIDKENTHMIEKKEKPLTYQTIIPFAGASSIA